MRHSLIEPTSALYIVYPKLSYAILGGSLLGRHGLSRQLLSGLQTYNTLPGDGQKSINSATFASALQSSV